MENLNGGLYLIISSLILLIVYAIWGLDKILRIYYTFYYKLNNKMKNTNIDIYKSLLLVILAVFVYCYYLNSQNGRFVHFGETDEILDTRNGGLYRPLKEGYKFTSDSSFIIFQPIIK